MFLEHPLRYSTVNLDLIPSSMFFYLEVLELDMFGIIFRGVLRVELNLLEWN